MLVRLLAFTLVGLSAVTASALAEPPPAVAPGVPRSETLKPVAIYDANGDVIGSPDRPMPVMIMPFTRSGNGDPIVFTNIGPTPKQFSVTKPADATTYRFVNPCDVDVRIRKVGSMSEQVTVTTGTRYLARTDLTMGTSNPQFLSLMTVGAPTGDCSPELQYGRAGG